MRPKHKGCLPSLIQSWTHHVFKAEFIAVQLRMAKDSVCDLTSEVGKVNVTLLWSALFALAFLVKHDAKVKSCLHASEPLRAVFITWPCPSCNCSLCFWELEGGCN